MSNHAKLGPSAAHRWMTCTGSVAAVEAAMERLGEEKAGPAAELGTALHEAAEWCLTENEAPHNAVGKIFNGYEVLDEHLEWFEEYVYMVRGLTPGAELVALEEQVEVIPDLVWGTADAIVIKDGVLYVVDLKTGYNRVDAHDNYQLMLYALGAWLTYECVWSITKVVMVISQPRINNLSRQEVGLDELVLFHTRVLDVVAEIEEGGELRPSEDACRYCRARATCPALSGFALEAAQQDFADLDEAQLQYAYAQLPLLEIYIKGVKAGIMERLEKGIPVEGLKLVEGRKIRKWADEKHAEQYLSRRLPKWKENGYNHSLKSPAQMEKALKAHADELHRPVTEKMLDRLITQSAGKPTIASEDDKRPALEYGDRARADFVDVEPSDKP